MRAGGVQMWPDVSVPDEARLTVKDYGDRFVVRRLPLARGLDEVGREEIGHIVRSAVLAVLAGPRETLSRAEARVAVSSWPVRSGPVRTAPSPPPPAGASRDRSRVATSARRGPIRDEGAPWGGALDLGAVATLRAFSPAIPIVGELGGVAAVTGSSGASLWVEGAIAFQRGT